jgi:hypothetical protein
MTEMTDETRLRSFLHAALPPTVARPTRDLWPLVTAGPRRPPTWSRRDLSLAVTAALGVLLLPDAWFWFAYHF